MKMSESIANLAVAMNMFQAQVAGAKKSSDNPFYNSKYADLAEIWKTIREPLTANGLSILQPLDLSDPETVVVETLLLHKSGEWIMGSESVKPKKNDPQGMGSAITYARRYGLSAMLGIHQEDDDGNKASDKSNQRDTILKSISCMVSELQANLIDRWEQPSRRKESYKAHLSAEKPTECKDQAKLEAYEKHMQAKLSEYIAAEKKAATEVLKDFPATDADTYLAAINDCDTLTEICKIHDSIKREAK